jgi:hypothetical protein
LSADGTLWVWGNNANGELGLGTSTADYLAPQHLLPPSGEVFTSIDANCTGDHAIATLAVVPLPEPAGMSLLAVGGFLVSRRRTHRHAKSSAK